MINTTNPGQTSRLRKGLAVAILLPDAHADQDACEAILARTAKAIHDAAVTATTAH